MSALCYFLEHVLIWSKLLKLFPPHYCVVLFLRLVSSIHAVMATTAGVVVASSCRGDIINDRLAQLFETVQNGSDDVFSPESSVIKSEHGSEPFCN